MSNTSTAVMTITRTTSSESIIEEPLAPSQAFLREQIQRTISGTSAKTANTVATKQSKTSATSARSRYSRHPRHSRHSEGYTALSTPSLLPEFDPNPSSGLNSGLDFGHGLVDETGANIDATRAKDAKEEAAKKKYRLALAAFYWCFFTLGLNDGSTGPLLPTYQKTYHINFLTVSMIFISNCLGCLTSAVLNVAISRRVAFSKILVLGTIFQTLGYVIMSFAPTLSDKFYVMCIAFYINGMGMSLLNAQCNSLLSMLHNPSAMGFAHASYGTGALIAPLISTQFAKLANTQNMDKVNPKWAMYYLFMLCVALSDMASFIFAFKGKGYEEVLSGMGVHSNEEEQIELRQPVRPQNSEEGDASEAEQINRREQIAKKEKGSFVEVLKQVQVHLLAAFIFIYVGVEVTIGGWIVTFMINERGGGASAGYVSTGFFGGLAIGRVALLWVNRKLGERNAIFLYVATVIVLEITIWFVPSLITNAIAVSLVGLALGPFYPIVMSQTGRIIPRKVLAGSIGWIAGFGQSGSAVLPFVTGALANKLGIIALQPLIVGMAAAMGAIWFMVPTVNKRKE